MGTPGTIDGAIPPSNQSPGQSQLLMPQMINPYNSAWWVTQAASNIPNDSVGWLLAQGWQITGITYDTSTTPQTPYYTMTRQALQSWNILNSMLESWTTAHNNALEANAIRYNEVIENWSQLISTTYDHHAAEAEEQNDHFLLYSAALDTNMDEVDERIETNQSTLVTDAAPAATALTAMDTKLADLETNVDDKEATIAAYLTGLGTTELARITAAFAASLATQLQQLTDRGMYSSVIAADITARNTRDMNEEIAALNDRLNREKWENEHRILGHRQDAVKGYISGKERFSVITMQNASTMAEHRHREILEKMNESAVRIAGVQAKHDEVMQLMKYQLDERNKLFIGLYGFVEARTDSYPSFESLVQLCAGLGDAGGGWISP